MVFPKSKMRIIEVLDGKRPERGWLELNVAAVDIEGASKIHINLDEVLQLQAGRDASSDAARKARELLGGL